jgi:hypothetical protein
MVEMLTKNGWRVGLEEVKQAVSYWWDAPLRDDDAPRDIAPIFIPPEVQPLLKSTREEGGKLSNPGLDQRDVVDKGFDPAQVAAKPSGPPSTQTRAEESK